MSPSPRSLACAPLLHFTLIGAALFAADLLLNADTPEPIVVPRAFLDAQRAEIEARTGAPASDEALAAAAQTYALEEALFREALSIGLHRHDLVVRRRLVQQVEFLHLDLNVPDEPDEGALTRWLLDHPGDYQLPERRSLEHRFFSRDKRKDRAPLDALAALSLLDPKTPTPDGATPDVNLNIRAYLDTKNASDDASNDAALDAQPPLDAPPDPFALDPSDPFALGHALLNQSRQELAGRLGPEFAEAAFALPAGRWSGPIRSAFGHHLVRVTEILPGGPAPLDAVRPRVRADLLDQRRREAADAAARAALQRHPLVIEPEVDREGAPP